MFFEKKNFEEILEEREKTIKELEVQVETLERDMEYLFKGLGMNLEEIKEYLGDPRNFSKEIWNQLELERNNLDERLQKKLDNIHNPAKTKEAYASRNLPNYAIYCK